MALKCPSCGSVDTQAAVDNNQCLNCGRKFDFDGNLVAPGMDAATRDAIVASTEPRTVNVVGNLADLQRLGAQEVSDPKSTAFPPPPGVEASDLGPTGQAVFTAEGELEPVKPAKDEPKAKAK